MVTLSPTRPEGAEAHSPGQRPGLFWAVACRPVRAKALKLLAIHKAVALTGRIAHCLYTQGVALGYELLPFTFPLRAGDRWFRACCLLELLDLRPILKPLVILLLAYWYKITLYIYKVVK